MYSWARTRLLSLCLESRATSDHVTMKPHYIRPTLTGARPLSTRIETHPKHNLTQPKQSFNLLYVLTKPNPVCNPLNRKLPLRPF